MPEYISSLNIIHNCLIYVSIFSHEIDRVRELSESAVTSYIRLSLGLGLSDSDIPEHDPDSDQLSRTLDFLTQLCQAYPTISLRRRTFDPILRQLRLRQLDAQYWKLIQDMHQSQGLALVRGDSELLRLVEVMMRLTFISREWTQERFFVELETVLTLSHSMDISFMPKSFVNKLRLVFESYDLVVEKAQVIFNDVFIY